MDEIVVGAATAAQKEVFEKIKRKFTNEQREFLEKSLLSEGPIHVLEVVKCAGSLFSAIERFGVVALLSYENALRSLKVGNHSQANLPLMMAARASTNFLDADLVRAGLANVEKNAMTEQTSRAGRASQAKKYPWKMVAAKVARARWRESDILHNELARWLADEYRDAEGKQPFSAYLDGITIGKEHDALLRLLKEVAKEPEFAGRNLIKSQF